MRRRFWTLGKLFITRRSLLLVACVLAAAPVWGHAPRNDPEEMEVRAQAREAGLGPLVSRSTPEYLVIGDAPRAFQEEALKICEGLQTDYLEHFREKKLPAEKPSERLTVVVLSGPQAFAAFQGIAQDHAVGGEYDLETNRLVIFDNRAREAAGPNVRRANTVSLVHEATHQLTFNTGLLDRTGDVPACVSEGLAMYAEVRPPKGGREKVGSVNRQRLEVLRAGAPWFPVAKLLTEEALLADPQTAQPAYAESWLLVHYLLSQKPEAVRAYLEAIRPRRDAKHRLQDARACFGDLEQLDKALVAYAKRLSRMRGG
jgi:hypothetical protein